MKVSDATTHVKYYANHQMVITKLQTFNELEHVQGTEKSLRILQLNMERLNWFLGDVRIPKFNYNINYKTNQVTTFSEFMFGTQIHPKTAFSFRDTIYNSMINNDETWIYQEGIELMRTLSIFESLTSSYVLILTAKVNLNALYKAVYLSKSIRPNKYPKIRCQI